MIIDLNFKNLSNPKFPLERIYYQPYHQSYYKNHQRIAHNASFQYVTKANKKTVRFGILPLLMEENDRLIALYAQGLRVRSPDRQFPPIVLNTDLTTTACTRIPRVLFRTLNYSNVEETCMHAREKIHRKREERERHRERRRGNSFAIF